MTLEASGTLKAGTKIQYFSTMLRGEALSQFDALSAKVVSTSPETLSLIILGLGAYFFPVNTMSNQKRLLHRGTRNPRGLKVR